MMSGQDTRGSEPLQELVFVVLTIGTRVFVDTNGALLDLFDTFSGSRDRFKYWA